MHQQRTTRCVFKIPSRKSKEEIPVRSFFSKSLAVLALVLSLTLTTSSAFAAAPQHHGREQSRSAVQRIIGMIQRFFGVAPNDDIFIPHP